MKNDPTFTLTAAIILAGVIAAFANVSSTPAPRSAANVAAIEAPPAASAVAAPTTHLHRGHRHDIEKS